jgi:hypothetical protein
MVGPRSFDISQSWMILNLWNCPKFHFLPSIFSFDCLYILFLIYHFHAVSLLPCLWCLDQSTLVCWFFPVGASNCLHVVWRLTVVCLHTTVWFYHLLHLAQSSFASSLFSISTILASRASLCNSWCAKFLAENIGTIGRGGEYDILIASARYVGGRKVHWECGIALRKTRILHVDKSKSEQKINSSLESFGGQSPPGSGDFSVDSAQANLTQVPTAGGRRSGPPTGRDLRIMSVFLVGQGFALAGWKILNALASSTPHAWTRLRATW